MPLNLQPVATPSVPARLAEPLLEDAAPSSLAGGQSICLSAIIRETDPKVVSRCLRSCRPFLTEWAVVDTGSTEEVKATIRRDLAGLPGQLVDRVWPDDFSVARNWALDLARESAAEIAMFIDADDWVVPTFFLPRPDRIALPVLPKLEGPAYFPSLADDGEVCGRATFARLTPSLRWAGAVHESLNGIALAAIASYTIRYSNRPGDKCYPYFVALRAEVEKDPRNLSAWWHLARHYTGFRDYTAAIDCSEQVLSLLGTRMRQDNSLRYCALILRARSAAALGQPTRVILDDLMRARELCPERAEAQRHAARVLRHRLEQLTLARFLDEEADTRVMPLHGTSIDSTAYRRSPDLQAHVLAAAGAS